MAATPFPTRQREDHTHNVPVTDHRPSGRRRGDPSRAVSRDVGNLHIHPVERMSFPFHRHAGPRAGLAALAVLLGAGGALAAPFLYTPGDLLLTFRQPGNAEDLVVNLGPASTYSTLAAGQSVVVTRLPEGLLAATFPSLNGLSWSVLGANRPPTVPEFPLQTLWVAAGRIDAATPAPAWLRKGQFVQGNTGSQIDAIGRNAASFSSATPAGARNTATAVAIPVGNAFAPAPVLGEPPTLVGTFQGRVERATADDFDTDPANVSRADLFELLPGSRAEGTLDAPGRRLGYFELKPDGTVTFSTGEAPLTPPTISGIAFVDGSARVTFASVAGVHYRLRSTDAAGLSSPVSTWTSGTPVTADGATTTLQDPASGSARFYAVEASR